MADIKTSIRTLQSMLTLSAVLAAPSAIAVSGCESSSSDQTDISSRTGYKGVSHPSLIDHHAVLDHVRTDLNGDPAYAELSQLVTGLGLAIDGSPDLRSHDIGALIKGVDGLSAEIRKPSPDFSIINLQTIELEMIADAIRPDAKYVAAILLQIVHWVRFEWVMLPI